MTPDFLGTLPGWITAASTTSVAAVIIAILRRGVSMQGLRNADEADIRDHYADELERVIARQHACEDREQKLRDRVAALELRDTENRSEMMGLHRQIAQLSADKLLILEGRGRPSEVAPMATDAARRIKESDR